MGKLSVQAIDTTLVLKYLEPIWTTKPQTGCRFLSILGTETVTESDLDRRKGRFPSKRRLLVLCF